MRCFPYEIAVYNIEIPILKKNYFNLDIKLESLLIVAH